MADDPKLVAVKATKREFYALTHVVGGPLDEHGEGLWPRDQLTFRMMIVDGALKEIEPSALRSRAAEEPAPADAEQPAQRTKKG
jgi:hypothetical protein